jgi:hypothetical protein
MIFLRSPRALLLATIFVLTGFLGLSACNSNSSNAGSVGGVCFADHTCNHGNKCLDGTCTPCALGTLGCACADKTTCGDSLTCQSGTCWEDNGPVPANPVCYTPCRQGITDSTGTYIECSADGLMKACLDSAECTHGSCVRPASTSRQTLPIDAGGSLGGDAAVTTRSASASSANGVSCGGNVECPDFQVCIQGTCYSNCEYDSDCTGGKKCYRKSCRLPCSTSGTSMRTCPASTYCAALDSDNGFCMPLKDPPVDGGTKSTVEGSYDLSSETFHFSNTNITQVFTLTNHAPRALEFTITKVEHTEYADTGPTHVSMNPLPWMTIGEKGKAAKVNAFKVTVDGNDGKLDLEVDSNDPMAPKKWEGVLQVTSAELGNRRITMDYAAGADGRWAGKAYYFAQFGDRNLDAWMANRDDETALLQVGNAFVQRWGAMRRGRITLDEFNAVVTATVTSSWRWPSVQNVCPAAAGACYLYSNPDGFGRYCDSLDDQPVPSGIAELPIAMDLKSADSLHLLGRIVSTKSLQYAGDPAVSLTFGTDPAACTGNNSSACLALVDKLDATVVVGGRYQTTESDTGCSQASGFQLQKTPWLVPGFTTGASQDATSQTWYTYECRDTLQPFGASDTKNIPLNLSLAQSNPIPDARSRSRHIELVDGALVNQDSLYLIVRETFDGTFLGSSGNTGFAAYAFLMLQRTNAQLDANSFQGSAQLEVRSSSVDLGSKVLCSEDLLRKIFGIPAQQAPPAVASDPNKIARTLLDGVVPNTSPRFLSPPAPITSNNDLVHYLCHDTGLFDQGPPLVSAVMVPEPGGSPGPVTTPVETCPAGSGVTFFTGNVPQDLSVLDCQQNHTCQKVLDNWKVDPSVAVTLDPVWTCLDPSSAYCDSDRTDLRHGKQFYAQVGGADAVFLPLAEAIDTAFRYRTQFHNRQGTTLGFSPNICVADSNAVPYCYDPSGIEEIRSRVDCLAYIFAQRANLNVAQNTRDDIKSYLQTNFAYTNEYSPTLPTITHPGFEWLYSELLIMLGDDSYTKAFQSRFDLAASSLVSFEGSKIEPGGIDLAGVAGYEMYTLYQAAQYYQITLDRFYSLSPLLWQTVGSGLSDNYVDINTVVSYFTHVLRASTQKSRAWSEVGKRYQSFNRPDLARFVVERAYTSAYLESVVIVKMMRSVLQVSTPAQRASIRDEVDKASVTYKAALLEMRDVYAAFTDNVNYFGFPPDYIPFPDPDPNVPNVVEALLVTAKQAAQIASQKEDLAINDTKTFNTDAASFQSELTRIKNNYDDQLAEICGTFTGDDGHVYPAITTYAPLSAPTKVLADPCGFVGNGSLHDAMAGVDIAALDLKEQQARYDELNENIDSETAYIHGLCMQLMDLRSAECHAGAKVRTLQEQIQAAHDDMAVAQRNVQLAQAASSAMGACTPTTSFGLGGASINFGACMGSVLAAEFVDGAAAAEGRDQSAIDQAQADIDATQNAQCFVQAHGSCATEQANSAKTIKDYYAKFKEIDLDALKAADAARRAVSDVEKLRNQAKRLLAEKMESEGLAIDVEAAKNDPNVRIYKNDAVLAADRTFYSALQEAYKLTKVFEYYSSQSYAKLDELTLVRLVSRGDISLENYLADLESAYTQFRETYGHPDVRVDVESLRDDIMNIPRIDENGVALSQTDRVARFRTALTDPALLDARGFLTVPFSTSLGRLSPLTRNHKVLYIEAEVIGSDIGDNLGRVYVAQGGTGVVQALDGTKAYYRLPERTSVVNTLFNGVRVFTPDVYRNDRLRDRPFINTHWKFVLNQRDEAVNMDINLKSLTDIRVYVYYTDVTAL